MKTASFTLEKDSFTASERTIAEFDGLKASSFVYPSGIQALRLSNRRGHLVILPFMGQMIWDAVFDGVDLTMKNMFTIPRPASDILGTYGCFAFHSGLLANGCPSADDSHPMHGEMPVAPMDTAVLECGEDEGGSFMALAGTREYVMGFGAHYLARPRIKFRPDATLFDIVMDVENLAGDPMSLMYMCHVNFAFAEDAKIIQPTEFNSENTRVRKVVPAHVPQSPEYLEFLTELVENPGLMETMNEPDRYNPEQVFYLRNLRANSTGETATMMKRVEGDAFHIAYNINEFDHTVRWVLANADQQVCAFALPSTCEPEGLIAETGKGNVRHLNAGERAHFSVQLGYLDKAAAELAEQRIKTL